MKTAILIHSDPKAGEEAPGRVWASLLFGTPSFLRARDDRTLVLAAAETRTAAGDPLLANLQNRPEIGLLLIELATRRRLRINGRAQLDSNGDWLVEVERAYPNCPKYVQRRHWQLRNAKPAPSERTFRQGEQLNLPQQAWIARADTSFVASAHPEQGPDASHRGGRPGFVQVLSPHRLRIPDFSGNNMFNTLGNFAEYPQAGLVFLDFERGRILQLTGRAELVWGAPDECGETGGTARFWEFEIEAWRESASPIQLDWDFVDYSPYSPEPSAAADSLLSLQVERTWLETGRIKAFELRAADGRRGNAPHGVAPGSNVHARHSMIAAGCSPVPTPFAATMPFSHSAPSTGGAYRWPRSMPWREAVPWSSITTTAVSRADITQRSGTG